MADSDAATVPPMRTEDEEWLPLPDVPAGASLEAIADLHERLAPWDADADVSQARFRLRGC